MLKAYMVHDGEPEEKAVLVFAANAAEARRAGHHQDGIGDEGFFTLRANRLPAVDHLDRSEHGLFYIETKAAILRQAGFHSDGDDSCAHCGLYEMDGEFPICEECDSCPDCGHMDDCPNKEPAGDQPRPFTCTEPM